MTRKEKQVLQFIIDFKKSKGYPPTVKEIARGVNTKSTTHIREILIRLSEQGYISFIPKKPRTINILKTVS